MIEKFLNNKLLRSSVIIFSGLMFLNITNAFYTVILGRILGKGDFGSSAYGDFYSLNSFAYYFGIPITAFIAVSTKMIAEWFAKGETGKIKPFLGKFSKIIFFSSLIFLVLSLICSPLVSDFLKIKSNTATYFLMISISLSLSYPIFLGVFNGLHRFEWQFVLDVVGGSSKLLFGIPLAMIFGVTGAISGNIFLAILSFLVGITGYYFISKDIDTSQLQDFHFPWKLFSISIITTLSFSSLVTTDILLVKHFLTGIHPIDSEIDLPGIYGMLAFFGRILYFLVLTFANILIPFSSFEKAKGGDHVKVLKILSFCAISVTLPIVVLYSIFNDELIKILFGENYLYGSKYLLSFSISMIIYSLSAILNNYFISIGKIRFVVIPSFFAIVQIMLIVLFHDSIGEIITINTGINILTFIAMLGFFVFSKESK